MIWKVWAVVFGFTSVAAFVHYNFGWLPSPSTESLYVLAGAQAFALAHLMWREGDR